MATNDIPVGSIKSNSDTYKEKMKKQKLGENKEVKQVTTATAKVKKKSLGEKFSEAFIEEDVKNVRHYLIKEKLIPEAKSIFVDLVFDGLSMLLGTNRRRKDSEGRTNYAAVSSNYKYGNSNYRRDDSSDRNSRNDYSDIVYDTKEDANEVLSNLQSFADEYNQTSVADLFELSGISPKSFTDNNYGWTFDMLKHVPIRRIREGWILELPKPISID